MSCDPDATVKYLLHVFHPSCHKVRYIEGSSALLLFQGAFPARLKKVLIVGAPVWFRVPYNLLSLLLKEKLRERVGPDESRSFSGTNRRIW